MHHTRSICTMFDTYIHVRFNIYIQNMIPSIIYVYSDIFQYVLDLTYIYTIFNIQQQSIYARFNLLKLYTFTFFDAYCSRVTRPSSAWIPQTVRLNIAYAYSVLSHAASLAQSVKLMVSTGVLLGYPLQFFVAVQIMWPSAKQVCGMQGRSLAGELIFRSLLVLVTCK